MTAVKKNHYRGSFIFTAIALALGFVIGFAESGGNTIFAATMAGFATMISVAVLGVMETSLSFDNAVVNAKVLENWDEKWRRRFLTWGMLIAVFGMRLVFPILIVSIIAGINPIEVTSMALLNPSEYAKHLTDIHHEVAGFGGAFLLMVGLEFFFEEKHVYWMEWIETKLTVLGQITGVAGALTLVITYAISHIFMHGDHGAQFFVASVWGVICFIVFHGIGSLMEPESEDDDAPVIAATSASPNVVRKVIAGSWGGFFYLEMLDASFSFDGVIGAFAITNYLPVIALGLGIGAMFVRSMTIHLVDSGKLAEYRYLEHGAFYAILVLASIMFISATGVEIPEWITGLLGASIIGVSFLHSHHVNKAEAVA